MPEPRPRPPEEAWDGIVMANALLAAMEAATQRRKNPNASVSRAPSTIVASRVGSRSSARRLALTRGERDERRAAIHRFSRRDDGGARLALRANRRGLRASVNHTSNSQSNQSINQSNPRDIAHISPTLLASDSLRSHLLRVLSVPNRNRNLARESHPYSSSIFDDRSRRPRRTREIRITDRVSIHPSASASNGAKPRVECHRSIDRIASIVPLRSRVQSSRVESVASPSRVRRESSRDAYRAKDGGLSRCGEHDCRFPCRRGVSSSSFTSASERVHRDHRDRDHRVVNRRVMTRGVMRRERDPRDPDDFQEVGRTSANEVAMSRVRRIGHTGTTIV